MSRNDEEEEFDTYLDCASRAETGKAVLVVFPKYGEKWVPKSVIGDDSEVYRSPRYGTQDGASGKLVVAAWWSLKMIEEHEKGAKKR